MVPEDTIEGPISNLELVLHGVIRHLPGQSFKKKYGREEHGIRRRATKYVWYDGHLYRQEQRQISVVVSIPYWEKVMQTWHDEVGHLDARATTKTVIDRFWGQSMRRDVA